MGQKVEFLFKVCYSGENPDDSHLGRIAVPEDAAHPAQVLYEVQVPNAMDELVWVKAPNGGPPATVLKHLASVIAQHQGISAGVIPCTRGCEPDASVRMDGRLTIDLGTLFIDRPVES